MMVTTAMRRSSRAMLALAFVAIVAALPRAGEAGHAPFGLVHTTLDGGWISDKIGATYDHALKNTTTVTLVDRTNAPVAGSIELKGSRTQEFLDSIVFKPAAALSEANAPYTVTFNAVAEEDNSALQTSRTFKVDHLKPQDPVLANIDAVVTPGTPLTITGAGSDSVRATDTLKAFRSGVAKIELQFFRAEPAGMPSVGGLPAAPDPDALPVIDPNNPPTVGTPTVGLPVLSRHVFTSAATLQACSLEIAACTNAAGAIAQDTAFSYTPTTLTPGLWTVKAYVVDKAGNRSNAAERTFAYAG